MPSVSRVSSASSRSSARRRAPRCSRSERRQSGISPQLWCRELERRTIAKKLCCGPRQGIAPEPHRAGTASETAAAPVVGVAPKRAVSDLGLFRVVSGRKCLERDRIRLSGWVPPIGDSEPAMKRSRRLPAGSQRHGDHHITGMKPPVWWSHAAMDRMVDWRGGFRRGRGRGHRRRPDDRHRTYNLTPPVSPLGATNGHVASTARD